MNGGKRQEKQKICQIKHHHQYKYRDRQTDSTKENENVRDKVTRSGQARSIRNRNILQNSGSAALAQQQSVIQVSLRACLVQFSVREGDSDN